MVGWGDGRVVLGYSDDECCYCVKYWGFRTTSSELGPKIQCYGGKEDPLDAEPIYSQINWVRYAICKPIMAD
jgi:hypothetical protein